MTFETDIPLRGKEPESSDWIIMWDSSPRSFGQVSINVEDSLAMGANLVSTAIQPRKSVRD